MKTVKELQDAGFHCKNFIQAPDVRFSFNVRTLKVMPYSEIDSDEVLNLIVSSQKIHKKGSEVDIKEINEAKLVAWYPCEDSTKDKTKYLKSIILVDKENKNISDIIEYYCDICKDFKTLLHNHVDFTK